MFGKELDLIHKAVATGSKVAADDKFWARLADSEDLFAEIVELVKNSPTFHGNRCIKDVHVGEVATAWAACQAELSWSEEELKVGGWQALGFKPQARDSYVLPIVDDRSTFCDSAPLNRVLTMMDRAGYRPLHFEELLAARLADKNFMGDCEQVYAYGSVGVNKYGRNVVTRPLELEGHISNIVVVKK